MKWKKNSPNNSWSAALEWLQSFSRQWQPANSNVAEFLSARVQQFEPVAGVHTNKT